MPVEFAIWRLGTNTSRLTASPLPSESQLETLIAEDASVLGLDVLIIGRQVLTSFGKRIDLLGIDSEGDLHVIELKRDRTPRDVVAQALDYGSWVQMLDFDAIAAIASDYLGRHLAEAFADRFEAALPESLNPGHHLVIVASELDASTERIVNYLAGSGVPVNAIFFRHFADGDRSYLVRSWLLEPSMVETTVARAAAKGKEPWNGTDFYVSFGEPRRSWEDGVRFGFVAGGGGRWYWKTLEQLLPGSRVFACIPGIGFVGVGEVTAEAVPVSQFRVQIDGIEYPLLEAPGFKSQGMAEFVGDSEREERVVAVRWTKALPRAQAIWEKGMFANQNTACALRSSFTRGRVLERMGLTE